MEKLETILLKLKDEYLDAVDNLKTTNIPSGELLKIISIRHTGNYKDFRFYKHVSDAAEIGYKIFVIEEIIKNRSKRKFCIGPEAVDSQFDEYKLDLEMSRYFSINHELNPEDYDEADISLGLYLKNMDSRSLIEEGYIGASRHERHLLRNIEEEMWYIKEVE